MKININFVDAKMATGKSPCFAQEIEVKHQQKKIITNISFDNNDSKITFHFLCVEGRRVTCHKCSTLYG